MLVTIGVLAHNEERVIARTLRSLLAQSVFSEGHGLPAAAWEIVVVANGCSDETAALAAAELARARADGSFAEFSFRVVALPRPGKSNAWNELVHNVADPDTEIFAMMDADIVFCQTRTIENSIDELIRNDRAKIVVDLPLNDLTSRPRRRLLERLLARSSMFKFEGPPGVAGSFYCARGATLRAVWMPDGLPAEDGFLAAMVVTDGFRVPPEPGRVSRARDASHYYEGLTSLRGIIRHEVRLAIGTALNSYLCWDALHFLSTPEGASAGETIRLLNREKPRWYEQMMANAVANRGRWALPRGMLADRVRGRFRGWAGRSLGRKIGELPLRVAACALDLVVLVLANRHLRKGRTAHFW